jgi:virginiamycin B lyase
VPSLEGPGDPNCEVQIVLNFGHELHCIDPTVPLPDSLPGAVCVRAIRSKGAKLEVAASNESLPVKDRKMNPIPSVVRDNQHTRPGPCTITEFAIAPPHKKKKRDQHGSTHEITYNPNSGDALWITQPAYDFLVKAATDGKASYHSLPEGSGPHGIQFDGDGQLWVTLEGAGNIAKLDGNGHIVAEYDVRLDGSTGAPESNTHPHGLGIGSDGKTIWYTGKATGTVGKITPSGKIETFTLSAAGSAPIYIKAGPDGNMWITELVGNKIARITPEGKVTEFSIPTDNSRPIAIIPEPGGNAMWFTEEAGHIVGRIGMDGKIMEFPVPKSQDNVLLAGLSFDKEKNLWVQQYEYVKQNDPDPAEPDHIVKIDKAILTATSSDISNVPITFYPVPTRGTMMHRIILGPDGNMWFTELRTDKIGKLITSNP